MQEDGLDGLGVDKKELGSGSSWLHWHIIYQIVRSSIIPYSFILGWSIIWL